MSPEPIAPYKSGLVVLINASLFIVSLLNFLCDVFSSPRLNFLLESEPVTEQLRYRISLYVTGLFTRSRFSGPAQGQLGYRNKIPRGGESYAGRTAAANSPRSHVSSTRLYESAAAYALAPVLGVFTPWEGPRPTNIMSTLGNITHCAGNCGDVRHSLHSWSRRFIQQDSRALLLRSTTQSAGGSLNVHV